MKRICFFVVLIMSFFSNLIYIKADLPDSLGAIEQVGNKLVDNKDYGMHLKKGNNNQIVLCTDYFKLTPAKTDTACKKTTEWSEAARYGVAKIITESSSGIKASSDHANDAYFAAEMATNVFLFKNGEGSASLGDESLKNGYMTDATYYSLYKNYLDAADVAYNNYSSDASVNIVLSSSTLEFTLQGNNYISNTVTVSGVESYDVTTNIGQVTKSGNSFSVSVPSSSINGIETVTVSVTSSKSLPQARNYYCGDDYQTVTPIDIEYITKTTKKEISGTITSLGNLIINKLDENGNYLSGSTIVVRGPGYSNKFETNGSSIIIENLEFLNYGIAEESAPAGYAIDSVEKQVALTKNNPTATITIVNKLIKIDILKIDENDKPLSGAIIKLMDKDGNTLEICKDENGNNSACRWTTADKAYRIEGIPAGTYYLKEISTPKGYNVNPNKIEIVIDNYGKVKIDNKEIKDNLIKISNELTTTKVSKISAVNSKELPGANLEIINSKKEKISCIIKNDKGEKETLKECKWVSKDKPTYILGLDAGKYYLSETIAPEGYELNQNMVEFEIKADGTTTEVEMKNELSVKVPDTLSARSALLIAISMFDIALGIGIITYVKKNKVKE